MKLRKITSLTAALSFILMVITSVVLYIVPQGRVAYWANWRLWGLSKSDWGNVHINLGLLFLIAMGFHIYLNWKPLISYLKTKTRQLKILTSEFQIALLITVVFTVGTLMGIPPFKWVISFNDAVKSAGAQKYGEPPYGHAELSSLETFCKKTGLDLKQSLALLNQAGFSVASEQDSILEIAKSRGVSPQQVYLTIKNAKPQKTASKSQSSIFPDTPPPGTGKMTIAELAHQFGVDSEAAVRHLKENGWIVSENTTIREIAKKNNVSPMDVYTELTRVGASSGFPTE